MLIEFGVGVGALDLVRRGVGAHGQLVQDVHLAHLQTHADAGQTREGHGHAVHLLSWRVSNYHKGLSKRFKLGILSSVSIQYQFNLYDQFFLIFFKTKLLMINLKMEHCGAFYAPSYHIC